VKSICVAKFREVICLSDPKYGAITGIYYDNSMGLGVTYSGEPPPSHHHIPTSNPDSLADRKMGLGCIPTTVQLKDICHIDIWYSDDGCLGLEVTFSSGHNETLGRWDPKSPDFSREVVFNSGDDEQPFESMKIWMSGYFYKNRVGNGPILSVEV
jgi:hypothetical protein